MVSEQLITQLQRHEGYRRYPYVCPAGRLTIGYGRNLEIVGLRQAEALLLLRNDANQALYDLADLHPWALELDAARLDVLVNMVVNMGIGRFNGFQKMLQALRRGEFPHAAAEMLESRWYRQVGRRAEELCAQMQRGAYVIKNSDYT